MIDIGGRFINPSWIIYAEVESRHYVNGSTSWLVIKLDDGSEIRREHGHGFAAWAMLDKIKGS